MDEIQKMSGEIDFNNSTYHFKNPNFIGPLCIFEEIKNGNISIKKAK